MKLLYYRENLQQTCSRVCLCKKPKELVYLKTKCWFDNHRNSTKNKSLYKLNIWKDLFSFSSSVIAAFFFLSGLLWTCICTFCILTTKLWRPGSLTDQRGVFSFCLLDSVLWIMYFKCWCGSLSAMSLFWCCVSIRRCHFLFL